MDADHPSDGVLIPRRSTACGRNPRANGLVERLKGTIFDGFLRVKMRETFYDTVDALRANLDVWLVHYNTERPHLGYRNMAADLSKPSTHSSAKKVKRTIWRTKALLPRQALPPPPLGRPLLPRDQHNVLEHPQF